MTHIDNNYSKLCLLIYIINGVNSFNLQPIIVIPGKIVSINLNRSIDMDEEIAYNKIFGKIDIEENRIREIIKDILSLARYSHSGKTYTRRNYGIELSNYQLKVLDRAVKYGNEEINIDLNIVSFIHQIPDFIETQKICPETGYNKYIMLGSKKEKCGYVRYSREPTFSELLQIRKALMDKRNEYFKDKYEYYKNIDLD